MQPGDTVAIVGAGPIGLATIMTAKLFTPGRIIAIDLADARLEKALEFGADVTINNGTEDAVARVMELTDGLGVDVAVEAVGVPETFELCTAIVRPGGRVANVGVHGHSATLHLETLWIRDITITTGLVDTTTTPQLLKLIEERRLDPTPFATHRFALADTETAYDVFAAAAETHALKVVLHGRARAAPARAHRGPGDRAGGCCLSDDGTEKTAEGCRSAVHVAIRLGQRACYATRTSRQPTWRWSRRARQRLPTGRSSSCHPVWWR